MPSQNTPNESNFRVQGYEATWANGVFHEINKYIETKKASFSWVHKHSIYDLMLFPLGLPLSFWACYKSSKFIELMFADSNIFAKNCLYVYIFFVMLWIFRILFHYLRWLSPLVEFQNIKNKVTIHRFMFGTLLVGLIGSFLYDMIKFILINT